MQRKDIIAYGFALAACLLWSGNFLIARGVHEFIPPFTLAFWRWVVAFAVILPLGLPALRQQWPLVKRHWRFMTVLGVLSVGVYNTLIYKAAHFTTAHHLTLISSTAPIWTLLMAGLLRTERLSRYKIGGAAFAFAGALVVITHGHMERLLTVDWNTGDQMVLLAALIWAGYCVLLHYKPREMRQMTFLTVIFGVGMLSLLPFYLWEATHIPTPFTLPAVAAYGYIGIASSVLAWFAWNQAVHAIGSVKAGLMYYLIPVFSGLFAVWLLDEPLALYHGLGLALIFTGIVVSNLRKLGLVEETDQPRS